MCSSRCSRWSPAGRTATPRTTSSIDDGTVRVVSGEASDATVTFMQNWETATAIGRGELSAQGAFMTGLIRVRGDLPKLVEHGSVFGGVDDVFADLRAQTTY